MLGGEWCRFGRDNGSLLRAVRWCSVYRGMETDSNSQKESVSTTIKMLLFCMPPSIAMYRFHVRNHAIVGLSWVAGALLQALVPPRKQRLIPILFVTIIAAAVYTFVLK
jgi:hypothetical protein